MRRMVFWIFLIFLSQCKRTVTLDVSDLQKKKYPYNGYVYPLSGLNLRAAPKTGKVLAIMRMNESITIESCDENQPVAIDNRPGHWCKAKYGNLQGYAFSGYVTEYRHDFYYMVRALEGTALREKPEFPGKQLALVPTNHSGTILTVGVSAELQGKKGYWLNAEYKGMQGWFFSTEVVTSESEQQLWHHYSMKLTPVDLKEIEFNLVAERKIASSISEYQTKDYLVYQLDYKKSDDDCEGPRNRVVFHRIADNKFFGEKYFSEEIMEFNTNFENSVITYSRHCWCCCLAGEDATIYWLLKGKVMLMHYPMPSEKPRCVNNGLYALIRRHNEIRSVRNGSNTAYLFYMQKPKCAAAEGFADSNSSDLFAKLDLQSQSIQIEQYQDVGIPPAFSALWHGAKPITNDFRKPIMNEHED